eukprot:gnl/Chilomastix_caulleri/5944.p3 GENE.gnl/Chilomastix_caulleri/5944~~gnl/Chilomastix_caulleri/5944.p3  ORF type:complete len:54 (+),score=18.31 gnl/Chilomastix_caulleri/5944:213-374(+)
MTSGIVLDVGSKSCTEEWADWPGFHLVHAGSSQAKLRLKVKLAFEAKTGVSLE